MKNDDHLIFEAYKSFRTFVSEQGDVDIEKAKEAAKGVRKAADQLDKSLQAAKDAKDQVENNTDNQTSQEPQDQGQPAQTSIMGIPVGGSTPQPTTTSSTPAPAATTTPSQNVPSKEDSLKNIAATDQAMKGAAYRTNIQGSDKAIAGVFNKAYPATNTSQYLPNNNNIAMRASPTPQPVTPQTPPPANEQPLQDRLNAADQAGAAAAQKIAQDADEKAALEREKQVVANAQQAQQGQAPTIAAPAPNQGYKQFAQGRRTNVGYRAV